MAIEGVPEAPPLAATLAPMDGAPLPLPKIS
jgi:hypothetical protein